MTSIREADLNPWTDGDDLIRMLGQLGDQQRDELLDAVTRLLEHEDPDVREEALRLLLVRWKVRGLHHYGLQALTNDPTPEIRALAAYGVAATSSETSRMQDVTVLKSVVTNDDESHHVRGAAYDALLIIFRRPAFATKRRAFDAARDVDWTWVEALPTD
jgi:HEAT repeat protein